MLSNEFSLSLSLSLGGENNLWVSDVGGVCGLGGSGRRRGKEDVAVAEDRR